MPRIQFSLPDRFAFATDIPIYISHVNQGGHLDNAQLLTLVSEARVRFFKSLGYRESDVAGHPIVVGDMVAQYKSEGFHGETMRVRMLPQDFNRYGFDLVYRMDCADTGREVARGKIGIVFIDRETRRVAVVPEAFTQRLAELKAHGTWRLRPVQPGDMGWVVSRQTVLYTQEYGWNGEFEALAADIASRFIREFDPARERGWIAEMDGQIVGSVFLVKTDTPGTAKLRMLYVESAARGHGIGSRLVDECLAFARQAGYQRITLWTNSVLADASRLYERAGFQLIEEEPHHSFGHDLIGQVWARDC